MCNLSDSIELAPFRVLFDGDTPMISVPLFLMHVYPPEELKVVDGYLCCTFETNMWFLELDMDELKRLPEYNRKMFAGEYEQLLNQLSTACILEAAHFPAPAV